MRDWSRRALSEGEIALGRDMFGADVDWAQVRVLQLPPAGFFAAVPHKRTIVFSRWRARQDFAAAPVSEQGWFVHELAHVWQGARGVTLALAKLGAIGAKAYAVDRRAAPDFQSLNIEAQAEVARLLFLARRDGRADEEANWLEAAWAQRDGSS